MGGVSVLGGMLQCGWIWDVGPEPRRASLIPRQQNPPGDHLGLSPFRDDPSLSSLPDG